MQCYCWGGAIGHRPIQQKNGPLTTEIAILNIDRMAHGSFMFIGNKWKMSHTMVCPAITLLMSCHFYPYGMHIDIELHGGWTHLTYWPLSPGCV